MNEPLWTARAAWVFPIDGPPLREGCVTIRGDEIVAVEATASRPIDEELPTTALLPGLVNVHTHLEFSDLARPLGRPGGRFADWIAKVIAARFRRDADAADVALDKGMCEMRGAGVALAGEIAAVSNPATLLHSVRAIPTVVTFREIIGLAAEKEEERFALAERYLDAAEELGKARFAGISPHAPYTVRFSLFERLVDLAAARGVPVAMHLAESGEELELIRSHSGPLCDFLRDQEFWRPDAMPRGIRILDYLEVLARAPRAIVVHGTFLDDEEIAFLGQRADRMTVAYCPRTHAWFHRSTYPLADLLAAGANVALGTDSRASNPDLSLWNEVRFVRARFPEVAPQRLLEMATVRGAEALGVAERFGALSPGKSATMTAIDLGEAVAGDDPPWDALFAKTAAPRPFVPERRG